MARTAWTWGALLLAASLSMAQIGNGIAASPTEVKPLSKGALAPDATLMTPDGKTVELKSVLGKKPTVLIFFRGGWCPFCNRHLAELGSIERDLIGLGYQLVAISPDQPNKTMLTSEKSKASYRLLSDSKAEAIKAFGIGFRVDDATYTAYRDQFKLDLEAWSGMKHHILPVPAVFIVDGAGKIRFVYTNPDYKVRLKGQEILAAAKEAKL